MSSFAAFASGNEELENKETFADKLSIGGKAGINFANMKYSDPYMQDFNTTLFPRGLIGFCIEFYASDKLSVRPEMLLIGKGQRINEPDLFYRFKSNYVDMRLPFLLNFGSRQSLNPYVMFGPSLGIATSGNIMLDSWEVSQSNATLSAMELGVVIGAGLKFPINLSDFKIVAGAEIAYNRAFTDNYSLKEKQGAAYALNTTAYSIEGTRKNKGLEFVASLSIPLSNFKSKPKKTKKEPVVEPEVVAVVVDDRCYTIEEINEMADEGLDILNKKICMSDLNFDFGKSTLNQSSIVYLDKMVLLLERIPTMQMIISGHTDNVGAVEFNLNLSKERARAVYNYLIGKGVQDERLSYDFHGPDKPLFDNNTAENRQKNRRVEFMIVED
jgi:OOP family OmpA-OmpF porin